MNDQVLDKIIAIIADQLHSEESEVTPTTPLLNLNADSLDCVEIEMVIEEEFKISLFLDQTQFISCDDTPETIRGYVGAAQLRETNTVRKS